ncbi:MAG TPA: SAF domain-containing protein [Fredinandcohnia sp.]|nr:SAF domain-containing protein [Fredinandcohnia sp.]
MAKTKTTWPEITSGMIVGFLIGLPLAGMVAGFVAWAATQRRAQELAGDYQQYQVVIVTQPIRAGEPLRAAQVARRPVPAMVVSANTVSPDEINDLLGKPPSIDFEPGDLLLRSAFGLPPRASPPGAAQTD